MVVSGDIADKGDYSNNIKTVIKFFRDLKAKIVNKITKIQIVPGNHNKVRSPINKLMSIAHSILWLLSHPDYNYILYPYSNYKIGCS